MVGVKYTTRAGAGMTTSQSFNTIPEIRMNVMRMDGESGVSVLRGVWMRSA